MRIQEVIQQVALSKRAIKYYEEQGLLKVEKGANGYRNYTEEDITTLKEIAAYRKLGISIQDIRKLLVQKDPELLRQIYDQKKMALHANQQELEALHKFIQDHDVDAIYSSIDYQSIAKAMLDMLPGFYGHYWLNHFMPYLQDKITTPEQQKAYQAIVDFWDHVQIRIPLLLYIPSYFMYKLTPQPNWKNLTSLLDSQLQQYLNPSEEAYRKLCEKTRKNVKMRNNPLIKYHPVSIAQRRFMKQLQDCGYNDIFIPNMKILSPKYKEYHDALTAMNQRICTDLGLYYDSGYHFVMKK